MPNWCDNTLTISHPDPAVMEKAVAAWNDGKFLTTFVPEPDYETIVVLPTYPEIVGNNEPVDPKKSWWDWRVQNWGTKWEIGFDPDHGNRAELVNGKFTVGFMSAWSPPLPAYDSMMKQGFSILAYYFEPGCDFCGRYEDGIDDSYTASEGGIPEDIDQEMGISKTLEHYREII